MKTKKSSPTYTEILGSRDITVDVATSYLNICAHCGECLKQITFGPEKYNVILHYRDEKGDIVEWKPDKGDDIK